MRGPYTLFTLLGALALQACASANDSPTVTAIVSDSLVERVLGVAVPERITLSDEIEFFRSRLDRDPNDRLARSRLLAAHQLRFHVYGQEDDLRAAEEQLSGIASGSVPAGAVALALARHRFREAASAAEQTLEQARGDEYSTAQQRLFDAYLALGRYDDAEAQLKASGGEGTFGRHVREARLLDRKGDLDGALRLQRRAVALAESYAETAAVQAWSLVQLAHFEHHGGHSERALPLIDRAMELVPGLPAAYELLGSIAFTVDGNLDAADRLLARSIENGGHVSLLLTRADVALARGDSAAAESLRTHFLTSVQSDTATARLYYPVLARTLAERDETRQQALEYARRDLEQRRAAESIAVYAWALHLDGRQREARALFDEALAWGTPEPVVFELAGLAALDRGERQEAAQLLRVALDAERELGPVAAKEIRVRLAGAGATGAL